ncbi:MAG: peptidase M16 [Flavobacteriales bacterium]|nr:peptidase M16 [Flavobacteriales bacterium]|tara:strand:- start:8873 stop:11809 length:2937 start_codon:yes stop_codon:yes gene_type:complete
MQTKKFLTIVLVLISLCYLTFSSINNEKMKTENNYEYVDNDPLNARVYTLDNGLKVYLTSYADAPRVQTNIAVRAGSKNDPEDATGLAHYLEHMLFKGTDIYGTLDFEKEKPLLDKIESLYEEYRSIDMTDTVNRDRVWSQIDSISGEAAKFAIANEYDKMVTGLGAKGTNAYTSNEKTVYINDIPSNQIEKWLMLEAERFRYPVFRLFHTELETVYEEKNRGLDNDGRKMFEALLDGLFPTHQYGQQTTIGTIDHLKNPSLLEIRKYFDKYYVPNNMAICLSGDFDYDETIQLVEKHWGGFERKDDPSFDVIQESHLNAVVEKEVWGPEAERLYIGFRFDGANTEQSRLLTMMDMVLSNSSAGLIDLNLNQSQKVIGGGCFPMVMKDYSIHGFYGSPKPGQTLEEVKDLLLSQIKEVKVGNFPDWLVGAILSDLKLSQIKKMESNSGRANEFVDAFILDIPWSEHQNEMSELEKITKQDIINFANANYSDDNFVVVYKRNGEDTSIPKVEKPVITPVSVNREDQSDFLVSLSEEKVKDIEPVFLNFEEDIKKSTVGDVSLIYKENTENERFRLNYIVDMGTNHEKRLKLATDYLKFLGTEELSPAEVQQEFYKLGCDLSVSCGSDKTQVTLSGLQSNFETSLVLFENILANAIADEDALVNLKLAKMKERNDAKLNKQTILWSAMMNYAKHGENSAFRNKMSEEELNNVTSSELLDLIKNLSSYNHRIIYYGPENINEISNNLNTYHTSNTNLKDIPEGVSYEELPLDIPTVFVVDYEMQQAEILLLAKGGLLNITDIPKIKFHNSYFGGGMSSIVFQDMRESKALAYSVYSTYSIPKEGDKSHYSFSYVGTQSDKLQEALYSMTDLLENMPQADENMNNAKEGIEQKIRTERLTKSKILSEYEKAQKMGINYDLREDIYNKVQNFDMTTLLDFHNNYVAGKNRVVMILGDKEKLDMDVLKEYGEIKFLTLEDIFGY